MFILTDNEEAIRRLLKRPVVLILRSLNMSRVAKPSGEVSEAAFAYIIELEEKGDRIALYICFYLVSENVLMFYRHEDELEVGVDEIGNVEKEADSFVETMGFVMSDLLFQTLSPEKQVKTQKVLPFFFQSPEQFLKRFLLGYDDAIRHDFGVFIREVERVHGKKPKTDDERVCVGVAKVLTLY